MGAQSLRMEMVAKIAEARAERFADLVAAPWAGASPAEVTLAGVQALAAAAVVTAMAEHRTPAQALALVIVSAAAVAGEFGPVDEIDAIAVALARLTDVAATVLPAAAADPAPVPASLQAGLAIAGAQAAQPARS